MGVVEIFSGCLGVIRSVFWRFFLGVMKIFDGCLGDIWWVF